MYGDFSRFPGGLSGRYSGVLHQQGRLLLDAELNEQHAILLHYLRHLTTDLIGAFAGPVQEAGFKVEPVIKDGVCRAVRLSRGHYYVYGLRCQVPAPDQPADLALPVGPPEPPFVVYLVVWEQAISAAQAPGLIDPALSAGVPDTSRRSQVRWRLAARRELPGREGDLATLTPEEIKLAFQDHNADPERRPTLGARAHSGGPPHPGPSAAPAAWGYRGVENQLYRVEVHRDGGAHEATFKWSRDNGSVEFALQAITERDNEGMRTATLVRPWSDDEQGLEVGDWVELVDDHWAPLGTPPPLLRVQGVRLATRQITLQDTDRDRDVDLDRHPLLRRWDQQPEEAADPHKIPVEEGIPVEEAHRRWFELEDGVHVRFEAHAARYERGDYWLIPARTATSDVLWPRSQDADRAPLAVPPEGPARYRAPLALMRTLTDDPDAVADLRTLFGYRTAEQAPPASPAHPVAARDALLTNATTVIRPTRARYQIRSVSTVQPGAAFPVQDGTTLGRGSDVGINLDHSEVSRHHAVLRLDGDQLTITDLGSTNGTMVNGEPLTARVPAPLRPGDTIQFGSAELQFRVEEG